MRLDGYLGFLVIAFTALVLSGCGGGSKYRPLDSTPSGKSVPLTLAVMEFDDARPFKTESASGRRTFPFSFYKNYEFARPDEAYGGAVKAFPRSMAEQLADSLRDAGAFDSVIYVSSDDPLEPGQADVLLKTTLHQTTAKGSVFYYFLVFPFDFRLYDLPWALGFPKFSRSFNYDAEFQFVDAYTGKPIGQPMRASESTSSKWFTQYVSERKLGDHAEKQVVLYNDVIGRQLPQLPNPGDTYWADLRRDGQELLAQAQRDEERLRRGAVPTFSFLSPSDGSTIRGEQATVRWAATAGNGLRGLRVTLNGTEIDTGISPAEMRDEESATRTISARDLPVRLDIGRNLLRAEISDFRDNVVDAQLSVTRLPLELAPVNRHALLLGAGSNDARDAVTALDRVLSDPNLGQFPNVTAWTNNSFAAADVRNAIRSFGATPLAGELAFVYLAAPVRTSSGTLGASDMTVAEFITLLDQSLATDQVVVILDLDWDEAAGNDILAEMSALPARWAAAASHYAPRPAPRTNRAVLGAAAASVLEGQGGPSALTLENFLDELANRAELVDSLEPSIEGRYDRNITMRQYR